MARLSSLQEVIFYRGNRISFKGLLQSRYYKELNEATKMIYCEELSNSCPRRKNTTEIFGIKFDSYQKMKGILSLVLYNKYIYTVIKHWQATNYPDRAYVYEIFTFLHDN